MGQLRGFAEILHDRTASRTAELTAATHAAELLRSNEELEAFASLAAHDLQEPLRKMRAFSDRLERRSTGQLDPETSTLVGKIGDAALRMQLLIDGLLTYARLARTPRIPEPTELAEVVRDALADLSVAIEGAGATVEVK